jgi:transcriptional repressor NrdR
MLCPYCQEGDSRVVDTRKVGTGIRRRRECLRCGQRFTTYERVAAMSLMVAKHDGRREIFDREKLHLGIQKACAKRPVSEETIERLVGQIENDLFALGKAEVQSKAIGEMVMDRLRDVDDVAYVRFASVYRRFKDIDGLMAEIKEFRRRKQRDDAKRGTGGKAQRRR